MGRWRPPPAKSSPYISAMGYAALEQELEAIWVKRREVTQHLSAAAAEGDRSENAEYIYRKKELREIDRRIRYLQKRLPELKVVNHTPTNTNSVYFGASVTTELDSGERLQFKIVGADEIDSQRNHISVDSPMAKTMLGKSLDDIVNVITPSGTVEHTIVEIKYEET